MINKLNILGSTLKVLSSKLHALHFNLHGEHFLKYHKFLEKLYDKLVEDYDEVMERIRIKGAYPETRLQYQLQLSLITEEQSGPISDIEALKMVHHDYSLLINELHVYLQDEEIANDLIIQDFLIELTSAYEKTRWFLQASITK